MSLYISHLEKHIWTCISTRAYTTINPQHCDKSDFTYFADSPVYLEIKSDEETAKKLEKDSSTAVSDIPDQILNINDVAQTTNLKDMSSLAKGQKSSGTCYAYNVATLIRAIQRRYKLMLKDHHELVRWIIEKYGKNGADSHRVLKEYIKDMGNGFCTYEL